VDAVAMTRRMRPARGGISVGHHAITTGTVATGCYDATATPGLPSRFYLLSNNHVLANTNKAAVGDPILQPGPYEGAPTEKATSGHPSRYIEIRFLDGRPPPPVNEVDAAIAEVDLIDLDRHVHWVGDLRGLVAVPAVGMALSKCGRTTGFSTGQIT